MGYRGLMIDEVLSWHHDVDLITNASDSTRHPSCPEQLSRRGRLATNRIITYYKKHANDILEPGPTEFRIWVGKPETLEELSSTRCLSPITFVFIFAALGEHEKALDYLERAYEVHDTWLSYVSVYPAFQPLRQYERFNKILHRLGMAAEPENGAHSNVTDA